MTEKQELTNEDFVKNQSKNVLLYSTIFDKVVEISEMIQNKKSYPNQEIDTEKLAFLIIDLITICAKLTKSKADDKVAKMFKNVYILINGSTPKVNFIRLIKLRIKARRELRNKI